MTGRVDVDTRPGASIVRPTGDVDGATAGHVAAAARSALADPAPEHLIVDLTGVEYVDSSGVEVLFGLRQAAPPDTALIVVAPPGSIAARLFEIIRIDAVATVEPDLGAALRRAGSTP